jgi:uncharacterized protein (TIGR03435 family)
MRVQPGTRLLTPWEIDGMIKGGPLWTDLDTFDIVGVAENPSITTEKQLKQMLQRLLVDRFKLIFHRETHQIPGFGLVATQAATKLKPPSDGKAFAGMRGGSRHEFRNVTMPMFATYLARILRKPIIDNTNLIGAYNFTLSRWSQTEGEQKYLSNLPADVASELRIRDASSFPTLSAVLLQEIGMRLQPEMIPMRVIVIDNVEKPNIK